MATASSFNLDNILGRERCLLFANEESEAQRLPLTRLRSHSLRVAMLTLAWCSALRTAEPASPRPLWCRQQGTVQGFPSAHQRQQAGFGARVTSWFVLNVCTACLPVFPGSLLSLLVPFPVLIPTAQSRLGLSDSCFLQQGAPGPCLWPPRRWGLPRQTGGSEGSPDCLVYCCQDSPGLSVAPRM